MYRERFDALRRRTPSVNSLGPGPQPALEVWAYVQSRPEPTQAILTMGRRDVGFNSGLPMPLRWLRPPADAKDILAIGPGHEVTGLHDQHCIMGVPANSPLNFGDMVGFGISHPCTTFDKWQVLCIVDEAYDVVSAVRTFF